MSINDNSFKYVCIVSYLKLRFYCLICSTMSNLNSADFATPNVVRGFHSYKKNAAWVSQSDKYWNYWVLINAFWICLSFSDITRLNSKLLQERTQSWSRIRGWRSEKSFIPAANKILNFLLPTHQMTMNTITKMNMMR